MFMNCTFGALKPLAFFSILATYYLLLTTCYFVCGLRVNRYGETCPQLFIHLLFRSMGHRPLQNELPYGMNWLRHELNYVHELHLWCIKTACGLPRNYSLFIIHYSLFIKLKKLPAKRRAFDYISAPTQERFQ